MRLASTLTLPRILRRAYLLGQWGWPRFKLAGAGFVVTLVVGKEAAIGGSWMLASLHFLLFQVLGKLGRRQYRTSQI